jgi:amidase
VEFQSATQLSARLRARELSAVEVLDACARCYDQWNPRVNAVVTPLFEAARAQAHEADERLARGEDVGPLHGLPVALKDMTETRGVRTTYG